jgi:AcrR family transcriptional regulator
VFERFILPKDSSHPRMTRPPKRRRRRSSEEIIDRLIEAACDEFEHNGYAGAKTAATARKAGVAEALIFSNFGSKAKLFQDAIFKPLNRHFLDFRASHGVDTSDKKAMEQGVRQYIEELQEFVERHSRMLMSLFVAQLYAPGNLGASSHIQGLHDYFSRTTAMATARLVEPPKIHPRLIARVSFATILACVIFRDLLFPKGLASRDEIRTAISDFLMDGLNANAAPGKDRPRRRPAKRRQAPSLPRRV